MSETESKGHRIDIGDSPDYPGQVVIIFDSGTPQQHVIDLPPSAALALALACKSPRASAAFGHLLECVAATMQNSSCVSVIERSGNLDEPALTVERARGSRLDS